MLVVALAFGREARSFCRAVTRTPPPDWNAPAQGCFVDSAGGAKALFWKGSCVGYSLHYGASRRVTREQATEIVAGAFATWSSAACADGGSPSVRAVDLGPVECARVQYNREDGNQNVILFRDDEWPYLGSDATLGLTTLTFDTTTGELLGADIEINATQGLVVADAGTSGGYNLASVITHEVGHFLGLAHSTESDAMMATKYRASARLTNDDMQGLCSAYLPNGSRATTAGTVAGAFCDPTPPGGFISACSSPDEPTTSSGGGCSVQRGATSQGWCAVLIGILGLTFLTRRHARPPSAHDRAPRTTATTTTATSSPARPA
jgi:hypothetical protein